MTKSVDSGSSEIPELVPASDLTQEWIDDYLNEIAAPRGEKISSLAVYYPKEAPYQLRFVFSGIQRDQIEKHRAEVQLAATTSSNSNSNSEDQIKGPTQPNDIQKIVNSEDAPIIQEEDAELPESLENLVLPDIEIPVDDTSDDFEDTYYANLLRQYPDRILLTLEPLYLNQDSDETTTIMYTIDPPIDSGIVQHFRAKYQTGASASVSATSGSVTLSMWRWFRNVRNRIRRESLGSQTSIAGSGILQTALQHSDYPKKSTYDVSVMGNQDGSVYTISGYWEFSS